MNDLNNYQVGANYWDVNPTLTFKAAFKKLREADTSNNFEESSNIMWAIAFIYNYKSEYSDIEFKDRVEIIEKDFLGKERFFAENKMKLDPVIKEYMDLQFDAPRRLVVELHDLFDKRAKFMRETEYTADWYDEKGKKQAGTATLLDNMGKNSKSMFDHYLKIKQEVLKEEAKSSAKGGADLGLLESGKL